MSYRLEDLWVIIPVGGRATRLLPLTAETSKACIRLVNRPLVEISLLCLASQGIRNFIFGVKGYTNYRSLYDHFESGVGFSARYGLSPRIHINYQPNVDDLGSGDSARINMEYYDVKNPIFAVQGDNIFDVDISSFVTFHREKGGIMSIGLSMVQDVTGFGIAEIDSDMKIYRFVEKPKPEEAPSNLANTGLYMFSPEIREVFSSEDVRRLIAKRNRLDFGYDLIPYLIEQGYPVYGYVLNGNWYDVGTPERYLEAMQDILHGKLQCLQEFDGKVGDNSTIWIQGETPASLKRREEIIRKMRQGSIELNGSVLIGRHCQIGDGTRIINSCIDNYTTIGRNVNIENSAIMDRVCIGDNAYISNSILGRHVTVNSTFTKPTIIERMTTIADDVTIASGSRLAASKVYPHLQIPEGNYEEVTIRI
ncbi:MAG: NDP-sugar synthase [Candidatus Bathyarchaeia archaeon]